MKRLYRYQQENILKSKAREKAFTDVKKSPRKHQMVIGTTGLVISGGLVYWNSYSTMPATLALAVDETKPQFVKLKQPLTAQIHEIKAMIPKHLRKPWKLLHKANSGNAEEHLKSVRELSMATQGLCDGELCQMAQSMEMKTAVGLARMPESDLKLLLPPPPTPRDVKDSSIPIQFWSILSKLPATSDVPDCIKYFTTSALQDYVRQLEDVFVEDDDLNEEFHRDTHHIIALPKKNRHSLHHVIEYCLIALLSHSTLKSHCQILIQDSNLLPLLIRIAQEFQENVRLKSLIGKIIANICLFAETHQHLYASGWVRILAKWSRDPNIVVNLPAIKALANLDQYYAKNTYAPGIYLMLPNDRVVKHQNELSNRAVDVVFLHGLLGGVFYTWRQHDKVKERSWDDDNLVSEDKYSYCWPKDWMAEDFDSQDVRVIGVDFDAYVSQWGNSCPQESFKTSLKDRSKEFLDKLRKCGVGQRPVIFVGHSLGGLVVKQMILQAETEQDNEFVNNTKGIVFFSTPHLGSNVAKLSSMMKFFLFPTTEVQDLEANSSQLKNLNEHFVDLVNDKKNMKIISFGEAYQTPMMGMDTTFVTSKSSNIGIGEYFHLKANHINICKPDSKQSIIYRKFLDLVYDVIDDTVLR